MRQEDRRHAKEVVDILRVVCSVVGARSHVLLRDAEPAQEALSATCVAGLPPAMQLRADAYDFDVPPVEALPLEGDGAFG